MKPAPKLNYFQRLAAKIFNIPIITSKDKQAGAGSKGYMNTFLHYLHQDVTAGTTDTDFPKDLNSLYNLYDQMDIHSLEISTYLDTIAEESTFSLDDEIILLESPYKDIEHLLKGCIKRLQLQEKAKDYIRNLAKYGRFVVKPIYGFQGKPQIVTLDDALHKHQESYYARNILPVFNEYGIQTGWKHALLTSTYATDQEEYKIHEFLEFKLGHHPFGESLLRNLELFWPNLNQVERSLDLYRSSRPPLYFLHKLAVSDLDPSEYASLVSWVKSFLDMTLKLSNNSREVSVPNSGSAFQSLFYPKTALDGEDSLEIVENNPNISAIKDIEYKRSKLLGKLAIPKNYVTGEELKFSTLSGTDPRVLRRIVYLQKSFLQTVDKILQLELALLNITYKPSMYVLKMPRNTDMLELRNLDKIRLALDTYEGLVGMADALGVDRQTWTKFVVEDYLSYPFGYLLQRFESFQNQSVSNSKQRYAESRKVQEGSSIVDKSMPTFTTWASAPVPADWISEFLSKIK